MIGLILCAGCISLVRLVGAIRLDVSDPTSIRNAAGTIAHEVMSYYNGNVSGDPTMIGDLPDPYYWWQAGALWGAMLDYYHYTSDASYNQVVLEALLAPANTGPSHDFNPPEHHFELGNDDLAFWGFAVLSAAERNFSQPSWLDMGENVFRALSLRWNDTHCGGGVLWQVFESNPNGIDYKNTVTNGGLFQLAARLARATGQRRYVDWAARARNWSVDRGLVGKSRTVYDGAHASENCKRVNHVAFTYTAGIYLHGAAVLAEHTGDNIWADRAKGLLDAAEEHFFGPSKKTANIMYEQACEPSDKCNHDMKSLKGYLARFMWQSTYYMPSLRPKVSQLLEASSLAAAQACTGGDDGVTCGQKWYVDGFDGSVGLGQQTCALETIQGLLIEQTDPQFSADDVREVRETKWKKPKDTNGSTGGSGDGHDNSEGDADEEDGAAARLDLRRLPLLTAVSPGLAILRVLLNL